MHKFRSKCILNAWLCIQVEMLENIYPCSYAFKISDISKMIVSQKYLSRAINKSMNHFIEISLYVIVFGLVMFDEELCRLFKYVEIMKYMSYVWLVTYN